MKKFLISLIGAAALLANPIATCINYGGIYVPDKGCLIEGRAYCGGTLTIYLKDDINPQINTNETTSGEYVYGWVGAEIPRFAQGYVERGDFEDNGIQFNAMIDASCKPLPDDLIIKRDTLLLKYGREFKKDGFFIRYGNEAFDWAYIKNDGSLIAFLKPSSAGYLDYAVVDLRKDPILSITIKNDSVEIKEGE